MCQVASSHLHSLTANSSANNSTAPAWSVRSCDQETMFKEIKQILRQISLFLSFLFFNWWEAYSLLKSKNQKTSHLHFMIELNSLILPMKRMRLRNEIYVHKSLKTTTLFYFSY